MHRKSKDSGRDWQIACVLAYLLVAGVEVAAVASLLLYAAVLFAGAFAP